MRRAKKKNNITIQINRGRMNHYRWTIEDDGYWLRIMLKKIKSPGMGLKENIVYSRWKNWMENISCRIQKLAEGFI